MSSSWRAVATALLCSLVSSSTATAGEIQLLSRVGTSGPSAGTASTSPSISGDGRYVAFTSASSLLAAGANGHVQVFVRDRLTATTRVASRADGVTGDANTTAAWDPSISDDGRYVAFVSDAPGLVKDQPGGSAEIYVRDLATGTTTLVSRADTDADASANGESVSPSISADGRRVAFASSATNLSASDNAAAVDIFVRDLDAKTTTYVSHAGATASAGSSSDPRISGDGKHVVYVSSAANLAAGTNTFGANILLSNLDGAAPTLVSAGADGTAGSPSISTDGSAVSFISTATKLSPDILQPTNAYLRVGGKTTLLNRGPGTGTPAPATPVLGAALSGNAKQVAITYGGNGGIILRSITSGAVQTVVATPRPVGVFTRGGVVARDGNTVTFVADNGVFGEGNPNVEGVYAADVRDPLPVLLSAPVIEGDPSRSANVGATLTCREAAWENAAKAVTTWQHNGIAIKGASGATYTIVDADKNTSIACVSTATNAAGSRESVSAAVSIYVADTTTDTTDGDGSATTSGNFRIRFVRPLNHARAGTSTRVWLRTTAPTVLRITLGGTQRTLYVRRVGLIPIAIDTRRLAGRSVAIRVLARGHSHVIARATTRLKLAAG